MGSWRGFVKYIIAIGMIICRRCEENKPATPEYYNFAKPGLLKKICKICKSKAAKEWHKKNPEYRKRYYLRTKERHRKLLRAGKLRREYGMTVEDYANMAAAQRGMCAICQQEKKLAVDHCHKTGQVRGLLCHGCNQGLGLFKDDPIRLMEAVRYLAKRPALRVAV